MNIERRREIVRQCLKKRRARLKAEGICQDCGKVPAKAGRTLCEPCIASRDRWNRQCAKLRKEQQRWRAKRRAAGFCQDCASGRRPEPSRTLCRVCLWRRKEYMAGVRGKSTESTERVERLLRLAGL